jgi:hypothetical protein
MPSPTARNSCSAGCASSVGSSGAGSPPGASRCSPATATASAASSPPTIVVLTFAALFLLPTFLNGAIPTIQQGADALQISLNAIHGRVFFAQFHLDTLQSWLATAESVIGIVIEGVFVAMIIQRLFR